MEDTISHDMAMEQGLRQMDQDLRQIRAAAEQRERRERIAVAAMEGLLAGRLTSEVTRPIAVIAAEHADMLMAELDK